MPTFTLSQYQREWRNRASRLRKVAKKSTNAAAQFMVATARGMAPSKTGALRKGIVAKPIKDAEWEVSSSVQKSFPYNLWVNQSAPFRRIHPWWNEFRATTYGDGTHRITGSPRFWHFSTLRTQKLFGRVARKNFQSIFKGLKVSIK